jgi:hypothetical protein
MPARVMNLVASFVASVLLFAVLLGWFGGADSGSRRNLVMLLHDAAGRAPAGHSSGRKSFTESLFLAFHLPKASIRATFLGVLNPKPQKLSLMYPGKFMFSEAVQELRSTN